MQIHAIVDDGTGERKITTAKLSSKQRVKKQKSFSFIDRNNVYFMQNRTIIGVKLTEASYLNI
jgi:phosphoserine aminotransferase